MNALPKIAQKLSRQLIGITLLTGLVLPLTLHAAEAPPTGNAVQSVETTTLPGGKVVVRVTLKKALTAVPAGFTVGNPPRIALDLPDTGNAMGRNMVEANLGPLTSVNVVQAGTRTRLVLNLNKSAEYDAKIEGKTLIVALGDLSAGAAIANVSPRFADAAPGAGSQTIRDIDFRRGGAGEARIVTTLSDARAGINIRQQANGIVVDFIGAALPKALQRRLDVADFGTPVQTVETYALGDNTRMVIQPKGGWEYAAYQTDTSFIVEVKKSGDAQNKTADGKVKYVGEKLSLNFQNVEVRSVLQVIADFTGLNIIASDSVGGNLTLRLKDVPWDQALDLIMQTKGLDKRQNGNVIAIAPKEELIAREKQELEFRQSKLLIEIVQTQDFPLNYLRASAAAGVLTGKGGTGGAAATSEKVDCTAQAQGLTGGLAQTGGAVGTSGAINSAGGQTTLLTENRILTRQGSVAFESQSNTVIVTDVPSKLEEIRVLLAKLDVPSRQVMIEARVVIADTGWSRDLGAKLGLTALNRTGRYQSGLSGSQDQASALTQGFFPRQAIDGSQLNTFTPDPFDRVAVPILGTGTNLINFPAGIGAAQVALSLLDASTGNLLSLELSALEADNRGKIVSNPRVMTSNQKPAVILNGTQIPFITPGTANSPPTVSFKDVFLCLLVDPQILNNDSLIMTVEIQKDNVDPARTVSVAGISVPSIATRRVKTEVRVNNGETLVLGGIFDQSELNNATKVPFLGDLPFFGNLFKTTFKQDQKSELIIFITPRIIEDRLSIR